MILDQGIGAHHAQLEYFGLGAAWTWVSGEGAEVVDPSTLYGWLEYSATGRMHYSSKGQAQYTAEGRTHYTPSQED